LFIRGCADFALALRLATLQAGCYFVFFHSLHEGAVFISQRSEFFHRPVLSAQGPIDNAFEKESEMTVEIARPSMLLLIRHAESARNQAKKGATYFADEYARRMVKGIPDNKIPLTPEGIRQARETGVVVRERFGAPDYLYHSGYERTIQTADGILAAYPESERERIQVRHNLFIRERDPGYSYDMTQEEAEAAFPWLKEYWRTQGGFLARPPGGESLADVVNRVYMFLNMLFRDRGGKKVFVVMHGGTLRCFRYILERWTYDQALAWPSGQSPRNCGLTLYGFDQEKERLVLREYNTVCWK
jgi:broad specificity phosphatase PhoE